MSSLRNPFRERICGGVSLPIFRFGGFQVLNACAGLQKGEVLACGFGALGCCIPFLAAVVE